MLAGASVVTMTISSCLHPLSWWQAINSSSSTKQHKFRVQTSSREYHRANTTTPASRPTLCLFVQIQGSRHQLAAGCDWVFFLSPARLRLGAVAERLASLWIRAFLSSPAASCAKLCLIGKPEKGRRRAWRSHGQKWHFPSVYVGQNRWNNGFMKEIWQNATFS